MAVFNDPPSGDARRVNCLASPGKDPTKPPKFKAAYGTAKKARNTLKRLRRATRSKAQQVARTMYYRAKYHKYQTPGMKAAMKVYGDYLKTH